MVYFQMKYPLNCNIAEYRYQKLVSKGRKPKWFSKRLWCKFWKAVLCAPEIQLYLMNLGTIFMGLYYSNFFFSWQLLTIINFSPKFKLLIYSFSYELKIIMITFSLLAIILFILTMHVFFQFS